MQTIYKPADNNTYYKYRVWTKEQLPEQLFQLIGSNITSIPDEDKYIEIGPYMHTVTPWCSNALAILHKMKITNISRIEKYTLYPINSDYTYDPMVSCIYNSDINNSTIELSNNCIYEVPDIGVENEEQQLGFDNQDIAYYNQLFEQLNRCPNNIELADLAQSNSEHSRHWFFKGRLIKDNNALPQTLFQMIKETQSYTNDRSIIAFSDNASAIRGYNITTIVPKIENNYQFLPVNHLMHLTLTAETHNFPTGICPFQGANTGVGGRIRDTQAIGRGGYPIASLAGYSVGDITNCHYKDKSRKTLLEASDGASDYGNKFGEPIIGGFCRTYSKDGVAWIKPIMFSAGVGLVADKDVNKLEPCVNNLVIKIGGPAYKIGMGGGSASSRDQDTQNYNQDLNAVQRGDPEMENKMNRVIRACIESNNNPILSIHDQGAGGTANVTKEIVYPQGAIINLDNVVIGDPTMSSLELWISEYQEQNTVLIKSSDYPLLEQIAKRENVPIACIGHVTGTGKIEVYHKNKQIMDLPLEPVVGNTGLQKEYVLTYLDNDLSTNDLLTTDLLTDNISWSQYNVVQLVEQVFSLPSVGSKRFLTNKVDRSVTGLVVQQQCIGPLHTPLSDYSIVAQSHFSKTGIVTAIGEAPTKGIKGITNSEVMAHLAVGEMLTNMIFAPITDISDIRVSGNWMWALNYDGEKDRLYKACKAMCNSVKELGFALDGGKDSLSMSYKDRENNKTIKCPPNLVITGYAPCPDITMRLVQPYFHKAGNHIMYIRLSDCKSYKLGGTALSYILDDALTNFTDFRDWKKMKYVFEQIQKLLRQGYIIAGHDVSDGGLITTISEMAFATPKYGYIINLKDICETHDDVIPALFNEDLGLILEVEPHNTYIFQEIFCDYCYDLGQVTDDSIISIQYKDDIILSEEMRSMRAKWEKPSYELEKYQCHNSCVEQEMQAINEFRQFEYKVTTQPTKLFELINELPINELQTNKPKVAIIRDEGSNGDREMASAFYLAGFDTYDICINDFILNPNLTLDMFKGIALVGGFTYSDTFGSAKGWYSVINNNPRIKQEFHKFYEREDTFGLGICNGCQLMVQLGYISNNIQLVENESGRFESRFSTVKINNTNSIFMKGMANSVLGIWLAHGEGRFQISNNEDINIASQYVDDNLLVTQRYPFNPNGSDLAIASISSENGRFLAMMPHPERCFLQWQLPYKTEEIEKFDNKFSPWFSLFTNAYEWTINQ